MCWKLIDAILDRTAALLGALIFIQIPGFMRQYMQRLEGAIDELSRQIQELTRLAKGNGKTLQQFIQKFLEAQDSDFHSQGEFLQGIIDRREELLHNLNSFKESSPLVKPFSFFFHIQKELASKTYQSYDLTFEFTIEGTVYLLIGLFVGYFIYTGIKTLIIKLFSKN